MTQTVGAALARKLSVGQEEQGDKPRSVLRALRLAFARAAGDRLQLSLAVISAKQSHRTSDTLENSIGDDWLLLQLVNASGMSAAVCLDQGAVSAIVQMQTIGEVLPESPEPRAFTQTDAAMVAPLVDDAISRAVTLVDAARDQSDLSGFEFASRFEDQRTMSLAMVEETYRAFDLTAEFGRGLRQGKISVLVPEQPQLIDEIEADVEEAGPNLDQASGVLRAELNTVICRMSLPLASLSQLTIGDVVPLTGSRLDRAEILTIDRTRAAVGRLGQCGGMRAVRLNEYASMQTLGQPDEHEFLEANSRALANDLVDVSEVEAVVPAFDLQTQNDLTADLDFAGSDKMVAEISQLAGLNPLGEDSIEIE